MNRTMMFICYIPFSECISLHLYCGFENVPLHVLNIPPEGLLITSHDDSISCGYRVFVRFSTSSHEWVGTCKTSMLLSKFPDTWFHNSLSCDLQDSPALYHTLKLEVRSLFYVRDSNNIAYTSFCKPACIHDILHFLQLPLACMYADTYGNCLHTL